MRLLAIVHQSDAGPGVFAEAIREMGGEIDVWMPPERAEPAADPLGYDGVLVLGGAMNVDQEDAHPWLRGEIALLAELLDAGRPLLGLCLGGQLLATAAGAPARRAARPEIGWLPVELTPEGAEDPLLAPLAPSFEAFQWHSYEFPLPDGAVALARSDVSLQACRLGAAAWALQFHPEVSAADAAHWIENYRSDPDAVEIELDPSALGEETDRKLPAFNELGRDICRRWLEAAVD